MATMNIDESLVIENKRFEDKDEAPVEEAEFLFESIKKKPSGTKKGKQACGTDFEGWRLIGETSTEKFAKSFLQLGDSTLGRVNPEELDRNFSPLFDLKSDTVMKKVFGSHFVNVQLMTHNSKLNCLNDETVFSVFIEIEKNYTIRFETRNLNLKMLDKKLEGITPIRPSYPFSMTDKITKSKEDLELALQIYFHKLFFSKDEKLINISCLFIHSMIDTRDIPQQYLKEYKLQQKGNTIKKSVKTVYHSVLGFLKGQFNTQLTEFEQFQKMISLWVRDLKTLKKRVESVLTQQVNLNKETTQFEVLVGEIEAELGAIKKENLTKSDLELTKNCKKLLVNEEKTLSMTKLKKIIFILTSLLKDLNQILGYVYSNTMFTQNKESISLISQWYAPLILNTHKYCLELICESTNK